MTDQTPSSALEEHRFPCDACGSDLRFAPDDGSLICDHCGNTQALKESPWGGITEIDFQKAIKGEFGREETEVTRVMGCPNCGAQVEFDANTHSAECPFCATPVVTDTGEHRHIKPKGLLPFAFDETTARSAVKDWLGGLWFAPNGVQKYARKGRAMQGIYVPYWTYDADTASRYTGQRGTAYYVTQTVIRDGKPQQVRVRKMRWRNVRGQVSRFFDDVLVLGSTSLPRRFTERLEPWDLSDLRPYMPEYLAGLRAEGYTIDVSEGFEDAKEKMRRVIERDVRFDIGGDAQRIDDLRTSMSDVTFKHVLLPVWMAAYKYRGKTYRLVVNGRTGQVQGERPYSFWKIFFAVLLLAIAAGAVGYGYAVAEGLV